MKIIKYCSFLILVLFCLAAGNRPVHVFMAGDSTMANKVIYRSTPDPVTGEMVPDSWPERGWGQLLPEYFGKNVVIDNRARNGRSTRTFIEEGLWDKLINDVQKGDYVVIQFGHNDEVETKKSYTPPADFKKNLERFINEVQAKKGIPILCTAVERRKFEKGVLQDTHGAYPGYLREVAKAKNVVFIDLQEKTRDLLNETGEEASKKYFMYVAPGVNRNFPNGIEDNTHFSAMGANAVAGLFVEGLKEQKILPLVRQLKENMPSYVSQVWVSDLSNGMYKNPVLYADYSDPDVCRVGDDYYMTASTFNCIPGLPILHSKDLVNWTIINYAIPKMYPESTDFNVPQHGNGVWAPSMRYYSGEYYIYYGDPDRGIYMTKTNDPAGVWSPLVLVKPGMGLIDSCPFWDEDGQCYLVHGFAGSRAGIKSMLAVTRLTPDGKSTIGESQIIYDGHDQDETIEGPKFYKRNGYYYVFAPAGGVATGWQVVLRSQNIFGPYERKVVLAQGKSTVNGPHQGAWVDTKTNEDWFLHFQDTYAYGRVVHLQPMFWKNDWPVIGEDKDGDGCGEPVMVYKKPNVGKNYPVSTPVESDEFNENQLGLQWQWHANPQSWWSFTNAEKGYLSLYSVQTPENYQSLWDVPNLLLQKTPAREFTATMKMDFRPSSKIVGERTGLLVMGLDYSLLSLKNTKTGWVLSQNECLKADKGGKEKVNDSILLSPGTVYLRVKVEDNATCQFSYSTDGNHFKNLGTVFTLKEGKWIGAKIGTFCTRPVKNNDGGRVDIDWFRIEDKTPAFPGAEGAGMYTSGGRGGNVYFVTSLEDSIVGDKKTGEGTLRWCLKQPGPRTVVFRTAGIIRLKSELNIPANTTIAGHSAPGDGICIADNVVRLDGDNVIVRYMRFRLGDLTKVVDDAFTGKGCKNVIIDHCSMSWSTDECASFYDNENFTLQWCILSESLRKSVHNKGIHGYGAIWGGHTASFHHNLFAHHDSRNPRMCGSRYSNRPDLELVDYRNNVIYNWGMNSGYAGEGGSYNIVNNYYKAGAASGNTNRIFQPNADDGSNKQPSGVWGTFYVNGNYVDKHPEVTADNWLGIHPNPNTKNKDEIRSKTEFSISIVNTDTPEKAYEKILAHAGASYKRDQTDARIIKETREGLAPMRTTGENSKPGMIDSQKDVGGWENYSFNANDLSVDNDRDGIPDQWLSSNYPGKKSTDKNKEGYTYLEVYLNSLVNPTVKK